MQRRLKNEIAVEQERGTRSARTHWYYCAMRIANKTIKQTKHKRGFFVYVVVCSRTQMKEQKQKRVIRLEPMEPR